MAVGYIGNTFHCDNHQNFVYIFIHLPPFLENAVLNIVSIGKENDQLPHDGTTEP